MMATMRHVTTMLSPLLFGLLLAGGLHLVQGDAGHPRVINLHPGGATTAAARSGGGHGCCVGESSGSHQTRCGDRELP